MRSAFRATAFLIGLLTSASGAFAATFSSCADEGSAPVLKGTLCAIEAMPTPASTGAEPVTIFIRKFPAATPRKGSVWLLAGGPGESGATFYPLIGTLRKSFPGFDLVIPDHRGTGFSSRLCPAEESVRSPGGSALVGAEWGSCFARLSAHPELARAFSVTAAARDIQRLIVRDRAERPDAEQIFLYGVSYGTQLALRALQLGDVPVNGVLLDSLVPSQTAVRWDLSHRSDIVDTVGRSVLASCDADAACQSRLGEPAEVAWRRLLALAAQDKAIAAGIPGGDLKRFFGSLLDDPPARDRIPALIEDLSAGRQDELARVLAGLKEASSRFGDFPQSPLSIPLVSIISTSENNLRPGLTIAQLREEDDRLLFTSPLPALLIDTGLPTYERDAFFGKLPNRIPRILIVHGTLDPKTPFEGAQSQVQSLRAVGEVGMVAVRDAPHFILLNAPDCFERAAHILLAKHMLAQASCSRDAKTSPQ